MSNWVIFIQPSKMVVYHCPSIHAYGLRYIKIPLTKFPDNVNIPLGLIKVWYLSILTNFTPAPASYGTLFVKNMHVMYHLSDDNSSLVWSIFIKFVQNLRSKKRRQTYHDKRVFKKLALINYTLWTQKYAVLKASVNVNISYY